MTIESGRNVGIDNVIRHHDVSEKICPDIWRGNNWERWYKFKTDPVS